MHAPHETKKVRSINSPWITKNIRKNMRHRDFLKKKAVETKSKHYHQAYKKESNELYKLIKKTLKLLIVVIKMLKKCGKQ